MGYEIKPEKKVYGENWKPENFLDKKGRINYIGNINATLSGLRRDSRNIRRGYWTEAGREGKSYNQIKKQVSLITGR